MKRLSSFLRLLSLFAAIPVGLIVARDKAPDGFYEGYTGFAIPAEPVLPAKETHPSLWFKASDLPDLTKRIQRDKWSLSRLFRIESEADLSTPLRAAPGGQDETETIHKYYGAMSMAARSHALLSLLADDPAKRDAHRQRAIELLLRAYDGPIFDLDSKKQGSPVDEIYRGSWLQNYAHAYDCVQSSLTPDVDAKIRERLGREAQCVYENLYAWTPDSPHNHLSKPAWGLGSMALALSSDPRAKAWLGRAIEAANKNTRYFFSGDGIYREGSHYLIFSLTNFVPFLYHYRNVSGVDCFPQFQPVFETMIEERNAYGWLPNIEDSYIRPAPTDLVAAAYAEAKTKLHSSAPLSEILTWGYTTTSFAPFEDEQKKSGFNYTGASWDYPLDIDELLTRDPTIDATAPDCDPNVFLAGGQTVLRSAWQSEKAAGQRYLLFHGVAVADNHNHDDQLSFIIQAEGQMMCSDGGYSRGTYTGAERTSWYNTAAAHNTLTFDGKAADKDPTNVTPPTSFRVEQPGLVGEEKSAFFGKKASWHRAMFWIGGDYYIAVDRVDAKQPGEVKSFLHGGRGTLTTNGLQRTWHYSEDRYGPAAKLHAWIIAPGATITEKQGELTYIKGDYAEFPYLETVSTNFSAPWITVLKPAAANDASAFTVEDRSTEGRSTIVASSAAEKTVVSVAANSGAFSLDGIESDAALVIVRRDSSGKVLNHFTQGGVYLRVDGQNIPLQ